MTNDTAVPDGQLDRRPPAIEGHEQRQRGQRDGRDEQDDDKHVEQPQRRLGLLEAGGIAQRDEGEVRPGRETEVGLQPFLDPLGRLEAREVGDLDGGWDDPARLESLEHGLEKSPQVEVDRPALRGDDRPNRPG